MPPGHRVHLPEDAGEHLLQDLFLPMSIGPVWEGFGRKDVGDPASSVHFIELSVFPKMAVHSVLCMR